MKTMQLALVAALAGGALVAGSVLGSRDATAQSTPTNPAAAQALRNARMGGCMTGFAGGAVLQGAYVCASPAPRCAAGYNAYDPRLEAGVFKYSCTSQRIPG